MVRPVTTILYVDDDADDQEIFCEILKSINPDITCLLAMSAQEALKILDGLEQLPDYIFLDVNMPAMNGVEFLRELRHHERYHQIGVVMYSTSRNQKNLEECKELGVVEFLTKGRTLEELYENISKVIPVN